MWYSANKQYFKTDFLVQELPNLSILELCIIRATVPALLFPFISLIQWSFRNWSHLLQINRKENWLYIFSCRCEVHSVCTRCGNKGHIRSLPRYIIIQRRFPRVQGTVVNQFGASAIRRNSRTWRWKEISMSGNVLMWKRHARITNEEKCWYNQQL